MALLPDLLPAGDVVLRRWVPPLAEALLTAVAASYDELHQWMPWAAEPPTGAGIRAVVVEGSAAFDGDVRWSYVVARPGHDEVLGSAGVHSRGTAGAVEIGYWIRSDATGHGYATKAAGALTSGAFAHLSSIDRVEIWADAANRASNAVAARLGFLVDRTVDHAVDAPGQSGQFHVHVMERDRWASGPGHPAPAAD
jgi:RimJ/RimL family protein N-acetyltransferase